MLGPGSSEGSDPHIAASFNTSPDFGEVPLRSIGLVQFNPMQGDIPSNTRRIITELRKARQQGAKLVVFPEVATTGTSVGDDLLYDDFLIKNKQALNRIAKECSDISAVIGFVDFDQTRRNDDGSFLRYNAAAVISNGRIEAITHKHYLASYGYFEDGHRYTIGEPSKPINVSIDGKPVRLGIVICQEMWNRDAEVSLVEKLVKQGAQMVVCINASPFEIGKVDKREEVIRSHCMCTGVPFVYLNTVGVADVSKTLIPHDGNSMIFDAQGRKVWQSPAFAESTDVVDLRCFHPLAAPSTAMDDVLEALVFGANDYFRKSKQSRIVVPFSGGIDSATALLIHCLAHGKENVLALGMPTKYNSSRTRNLAAEITEGFGIQYKNLSIDDLFASTRKKLEKLFGAECSALALENIPPRLRSLIVREFCNQFGYLLANCSNQTEIALGYCTIGGDQDGDISVIGDVPKHKMQALCEAIERKTGIKYPRQLFRLRPSAENAAGQFDPFDYSVVSPTVALFVKDHLSPTQIIQLYRKRELDPDEFLVDRKGRSVYERYDLGEFSHMVYETCSRVKQYSPKRVLGPAIIALDPFAFGFGTRHSTLSRYSG